MSKKSDTKTAHVPNVLSRKSFLRGLAAGTGGLLATGCATSAPPQAAATKPLPADAPLPLDTHDLDVWQRETDAVKPEVYCDYLYRQKGTNGLPALERLEVSWARLMREIDATTVTTTPAVWLVYNMGVIVKTPKTLFAIDLVHKHATELAPKLDFTLVSHFHSDHYLYGLYQAIDGAGKTVVSNFLCNYGAADWRKTGDNLNAPGGYTRAVKVFRIKDVEIRTTLTDHNDYLIDFTTTFEIKVGNWRMYHTGDCSNVQKLNPLWGDPDLWVVFPGCGIDIAAGAKKIRPKKMAFGHLWELGHSCGRLTTPMVRAASKKVADATGMVPAVPLWGERIV